MNLLYRLLIVCFITLSSVNAQNEPLKIGTSNFAPPFVMQHANNKIYGFDIDMMNSLCKIMKRTCQFQIMRFEELLPAVANNTIDAAVSSITITSERSKMVTFSLPYLLSYSRFLTRQSTDLKPFSLALLNDKTIGIEEGTIFADQIKDMGIKNPTIKEYPKTDVLVEALAEGNVDFALLDSPTTLYWEANSAGALKSVGPAYMYGFGLGIATNPNLLPAINSALLQYQSTNDFKLNFDRYLVQF